MSHKASKKGKGASNGNAAPFVIDVGEKVDKKIDQTIGEKLRAAGIRTEIGKSRSGNAPAAAGGAFGSGLRPGMFGGYRPWYSRYRPGMGQEIVTERKFTLIPASIKTVDTGDALTGLGLGILGNRALVRLTPSLWANDSRILHEGLAFVAGLVPLLFKRNATTLGVAIPGAVYLGGTIVDKIFDAVGLPAGRALRGADGAPRADAALQARQKLAAIQQRINLAQAQSQGQRPALPRVVAQAQ